MAKALVVDDERKMRRILQIQLERMGIDSTAVESAEEAAAIIQAKWGFGMEGGVLVTLPVPVELELDADIAERAIEMALSEAEAQGMRGKAITPFLLARVGELTGGESQRANIALLENNARVAAQIAQALAQQGAHNG